MPSASCRISARRRRPLLTRFCPCSMTRTTGCARRCRFSTAWSGNLPSTRCAAVLQDPDADTFMRSGARGRPGADRRRSHPLLRPAIIPLLEQSLMNSGTDDLLAAFLICNLLDLDAKESLPLIQQAFYGGAGQTTPSWRCAMSRRSSALRPLPNPQRKPRRGELNNPRNRQSFDGHPPIAIRGKQRRK